MDPQKNKLNAVTTEERGDKVTGPPLTIHLRRNLQFDNCRPNYSGLLE